MLEDSLKPASMASYEACWDWRQLSHSLRPFSSPMMLSRAQSRGAQLTCLVACDLAALCIAFQLVLLAIQWPVSLLLILSITLSATVKDMPTCQTSSKVSHLTTCGPYSSSTDVFDTHVLESIPVFHCRRQLRGFLLCYSSQMRHKIIEIL